jgi:regulator of replication initiation timing
MDEIKLHLVIDKVHSILHLVEKLGNNETWKKKLLKIITMVKDKMENNSVLRFWKSMSLYKPGMHLSTTFYYEVMNPLNICIKCYKWN